MAPAGAATGRKGVTPAAKPVKAEGGISLDNLFDDLKDYASSTITEDVKKKLPLVKNPGGWMTEISGGAKPLSARSASAVNRIPSNIAKAFPDGKPMTDRPEILKCNHCKRPVSKHAMPKHIEGCLNKKQEKQRKKKEAKDARDAAARKEKAGDSDDDDEEGAKKTATKNGGLTASKKRKAGDDDDDGAPTKKKKKKDEAKAKAPKAKPPVDVEKQCGVELPQGGQCARSLTCKSHSMGAKRAVPGRSAPYDKLLMEYQRKNQAKLHKAAFDANAPNPDDDSIPSGPIDSEEEKDTVLASIARAFGGAPVYQPTYVPLRKKYEFNRIRGMMQSAFGGRGGGNLFGTGGAEGGSGSLFAAGMPEVENIPPGRKAGVVAGARSMMAPANRKPSIASGA